MQPRQSGANEPVSNLITHMHETALVSLHSKVSRQHHTAVFFNQGSVEPKGSATEIQGFHGTASAQ